MANRANNIWTKAAAGSPGTNIARAQQSRWTGVPNERIMLMLEDRIGAMLEGISDATERQAAATAQLDLQTKLQAVAAKHGSLPQEECKGLHAYGVRGSTSTTKSVGAPAVGIRGGHVQGADLAPRPHRLTHLRQVAGGL